MMFHKLGLINKNQRGFTLIELMVVIAITGFVTSGATMAILQVINGSARTNNHMTAVRQVQNAGYWVSRDVHMVQNIVADPTGGGFPLTLTWTDWGNNEEHQVVYTLLDMPSGGLKNLQRSHSSNGITETIIIAQFIDPTVKDGEPQTKCEPTNGSLVFTVTATVGGGSQGQSETRIYEIVPRPGS